MVAFCDFINKPRPLSRLRRNGIARGDEIERCFCSGEPWQPLRAPATWQKPELYFGKAKTRLFGSHPVMAGKRNFQPAAKRRAMQRGDDRLWHILQRSADLVDIRALERRAEFGNVG